jgi:hypothetical protein
MTWVRLDDQFPDHPKVVAAGAQATWLYISGLCYCSRQLTDGRIPKPIVPRLTDLRKPYDLAERLVVVGLWRDEPGCYVVHDYLAHQRSKEQVEREREAANVRQKSRRDKKRSHGGSHGEVTRPELDTPTDSDIPPLTPPQSGREQKATLRSQGQNPRAVAARVRVEKLEAELRDCETCGAAGWNCDRCQRRMNELAAVAS